MTNDSKISDQSADPTGVVREGDVVSKIEKKGREKRTAGSGRSRRKKDGATGEKPPVTVSPVLQETVGGEKSPLAVVQNPPGATVPAFRLDIKADHVGSGLGFGIFPDLMRDQMRRASQGVQPKPDRVDLSVSALNAFLDDHHEVDVKKPVVVLISDAMMDAMNSGEAVIALP